ncbi:cytochrome P450 12b1, mitochondrial-like [Ctenocephalides felis]|uniref:cytochrome P450 12b1, mitochondrial-like n=1 Tax=Ctenocephalides felis TaxID=7515 RepID=UPI000E6E2FC7|nr:cytochrome P450 12b1, mitochondrial-like [Ctenocephalides felis]
MHKGIRLLITRINNRKFSTGYVKRQIVSEVSALSYDKIPGPSALPIIGTLHHFLPGGKLSGLNMLDLGLKLYEDYGDIVKLKGMPGKEDMVFVYDLDAIEKVYRTEGSWPVRPGLETREHYIKEKRPEIFKSVYGLLHSHGEEWQNIRTKVNQPMMQIKVTRQYVGWIEEIANDFIKRLQTLLDAEGNVPQNFLTEVDRWSLESIARIAVDTRLGCLDDNLAEDSDAYEIEILPSFWRYINTPKYKEMMQIFDCFTDIAIKHVSKAIKRLESNPTTNESNLSVLEKLLKIDPQVALVMALDMFFAGVDTTASSTISALYFLAKNPEKQNKLRSELRAIFPNNAPITAEGLNSSSYLKACFKETHRLKPVAVGNMRHAGTDIVLGGYFIPKGTYVMLYHHLAAKVKNQFPDSDKYLPERWLRTDPGSVPPAKSAHKFAYMPFGFGPRMCVGRRFAELEMEVLVTRLITNYQVDWNGPDMQYKSSLILGPTGPMRFRLTSIK